MHEHVHDHGHEAQRRSLRRLAFQPSTRGVAVGAIIGAVISSVISALLTKGPLTALNHGLLGAVVGVGLGELLSAERRCLTSHEIAYARDVFGDSLNYDTIRVVRNSMFASGAPITIGNTVCLKTEWEHFQGDTLELTEQGRHLLIHELCHVWQYQTAGPAYFPKSLIAQFRAWWREGSRQGAYQWGEVLDAELPWDSWNPEQQASLIEVYNVVMRRINAGMEDAGDRELLARLTPFIERVQQFDGAPH